MNKNEQNNLRNDETPAELRAVVGAMDRLADAERGSAPAGLEDRLFAASRASLGEAPAVIAKIGGPVGVMSGWRFRLAASVMIAAVGVAAAVWLNSRGAVTSGTGTAVGAASTDQLAQALEADLSAWATETSALASSSDSEVASLYASLNSIESGKISDPWDSLEVNDQEPSL